MESGVKTIFELRTEEGKSLLFTMSKLWVSWNLWIPFIQLGIWNFIDGWANSSNLLMSSFSDVKTYSSKLICFSFCSFYFNFITIWSKSEDYYKVSLAFLFCRDLHTSLSDYSEWRGIILRLAFSKKESETWRWGALKSLNSETLEVYSDLIFSFESLPMFDEIDFTILLIL
jgi:hypothetical protein